MTSCERQHEHGAVAVHVALMLVALLAFLAFAIDFGVLFASRRQAQNAADAAALAGAISLSYTNPNDQNLARNSAVAAAQRNSIWGGTPDVTTADISFPGCPPGSPGVAGTCVQANVYRTNYNRANGSPLPTFFANLVGVGEQGVRASATAQLVAGSGTADCVKPVAIPDRWVEFNPTTSTWNSNSFFQRYQENGNGAGALLTPADRYDPPTTNSDGSGFTVRDDYGTELTLKLGNGTQSIDPGFFYPIVLNPGCIGGNCYRNAWSNCSGIEVGPGTVFNPEPGAVVGPTNQGVQALIDLDPGASWSTSANGGRGGPVGGCMADGTCGRSPRWIAIPLFDVDAYQRARAINNDQGRNVPITIVKVIGFWLERQQGNDVEGRIMYYPTTSVVGAPIPGASSFTYNIILVR
jgi:Flp pilus assembly protein TadG